MTKEDLLAQALAVGFTEAQFKALTAPQRIAFLQAAATAKSAKAHVAYTTAQELMTQEAINTQRVYRARLIVGGAAPLVGF